MVAAGCQHWWLVGLFKNKVYDTMRHVKSARLLSL